MLKVFTLRVAFTILLSLCASTVLAQFASTFVLQDRSIDSSRPSVNITASVSDLRPVRPGLALDAELWRIAVPVLLSSDLGLSIRGNLSYPGISMRSDTVPEGLRGFLGSGGGASVSIWPYLKLRYIPGLTGFIYASWDQHVWTSSSTLVPTSDLLGQRVTLPGVCFVGELNRIFNRDSTSVTSPVLVQFDVAIEEIQFQNEQQFQTLIRDLSGDRLRYMRLRLGVLVSSTMLFVDRISNEDIELWSAGISVRLF